MQKLGIIGVGTIAEAMVHGFLSKAQEDLFIVLSPRGVTKSSFLTSRYPKSVSIARDNQDLVDFCTTIILAVRPEVAESVMAALSFRSEQHLISVVAGLTRERLLTLAAPVREITLAIPLPAMANGYAPTVIMPPNEPATLLFRRGGDVIPIADPQSYRALGTSTAIMACYFAFAGSAANWLMRNRVPENVARNYISSLLQGLSQTTQLKVNDSFQALENHHATPGSFNDTLRIKLTETGTFQAIAEGLDTLMKRMEG